MAKRNPPKIDQQPDLFAASFADIPIRDQRDTMERPFFSLAKKPRTTPIEYQGDIVGDISRRRGAIEIIDSKLGQAIITANVPLAEMFGYATAIRSLSKGRASYSMEPLAFEQVPTSVLNTILDTAKSRPAART